MTLSLLTNLAVCLLLIAGIVLGIVLIRRLAVLRAAQGELAAMGETLIAATAKAEAGLSELRRSAESDGEALQNRVASARDLKDDLNFLIDRANGAAERLERTIAEARTAGRPRAPAGQPGQPAPELRSAASPKVRPGRERPDAVPASPGGERLPPAGEQLLRALQGIR